MTTQTLYVEGRANLVIASVLIIVVLLALLATLFFYLSTRQSGAQMYVLRQLAGVSFGLIVPSIVFGVAWNAVTRPTQLVGPVIGAIICLTAVGMFVAAYPSDWNGYGADRTPETILLYALGVGVSIGGIALSVAANHTSTKQWLQKSGRSDAGQKGQLTMTNDNDTEDEPNHTDDESTTNATEETDSDSDMLAGDSSDLSEAAERLEQEDTAHPVESQPAASESGSASNDLVRSESGHGEEPVSGADDDVRASSDSPIADESIPSQRAGGSSPPTTVLLDGKEVNRAEAFELVYDQLDASRQENKQIKEQLHELQLENERLRTKLDIVEETSTTPMVEWNDGKVTTLDTAIESLDERLTRVERTKLSNDDLMVSIDGVQKPLPEALETLIQMVSTDNIPSATGRRDGQDSLETRVDGLSREVDAVKDLVETLYDRLTAPRTSSDRRRD
jgi:regulator of replication initiation timing